ncbi:MAG: hypothetical protein AB1711_08400 [Thermodesulfobacteriota bacterium]
MKCRVLRLARTVLLTSLMAFVPVVLFMLDGHLSACSAADVPVITEEDTFGVLDGEFSLNGLKGLYRWSIEQRWSGGKMIIRDDNTFGVADGEFIVRGFKSGYHQFPFDGNAEIRGRSEEKGRISYLPDQSATVTTAVKFVLANGAFHVMPGEGKIKLEVKNGYLTCADGTAVSVFALWVDVIEGEDRRWAMVKSERYNGMWVPKPLYKPLHFEKNGKLMGAYKDGSIHFGPGQSVTLYSKHELMLPDGTILLPNDNGIYKIEIRDGLPIFVDVKVYERVGDEELFRK